MAPQALGRDDAAGAGRLTLPIQTGMDAQVRELMERLGADAVRNSDGTELPELVHELAAKVYSTYFVGRGDNAWADAHPDEATRIFLSSDRVVATDESPLAIDLTASWFAEQVRPDVTCDTARWWQAYDRTVGEPLSPPPGAWRRTATRSRSWSRRPATPTRSATWPPRPGTPPRCTTTSPTAGTKTPRA